MDASLEDIAVLPGESFVGIPDDGEAIGDDKKGGASSCRIYRTAFLELLN